MSWLLQMGGNIYINLQWDKAGGSARPERIDNRTMRRRFTKLVIGILGLVCFFNFFFGRGCCGAGQAALTSWARKQDRGHTRHRPRQE